MGYCDFLQCWSLSPCPLHGKRASPKPEEPEEPVLSVFTTYYERTLEFEGPDGPVSQKLLGWSQGACDLVWDMVMPKIVALNSRLFANTTVLELGAGCGLVGMLASRFASRVDITDGDEEEVDLIAVNCRRFAAPCAQAAVLDWTAVEQATKLLPSYDVILGTQVVYVPKYIPHFAATIAHFLAPGGYALIYNDRTAVDADREGCKKILLRALESHNLAVSDVLANPENVKLPPGLLVELGQRPWAYLIKVTRK